MRVCLVPQKYPPDVGGVASASHRYARGLVEAGHEVIVVGLDSQVPPGSSESGVTDGARLPDGVLPAIDVPLPDPPPAFSEKDFAETPATALPDSAPPKESAKQAGGKA